MFTNNEAVISLIELLVKKAGFDVHKDYSEEELEKTKNSISSLIKEKQRAKDKKTFNEILDNLKVREANWENNAEIVGKSLIRAYNEGKSYNAVKDKIDSLVLLATSGTKDLTVTSVYEEIRNLEIEYENLLDKIKNTNYRNEEEKEMDSKYKVYLEAKIKDLEEELENLEKESNSLREVELKEVNIQAKIKEYASTLKNDLNRIESVISSSINSSINFDTFDRLEKAKSETDEKLSRATDLLNKTEKMLEDVRHNKESIKERINEIEIEKTRCVNKLNNINKKLDEDNYENNTLRMLDLNNSEILRLKIEELNNKKDVIYVDSNLVKEELIKEWGRNSNNTSVNINTPIKEEKKEEKPKEEVKEEVKVNVQHKEEKKEPPKIEVSFEEIEEVKGREEPKEDVLNSIMEEIDNVEEKINEIKTNEEKKEEEKGIELDW